MGQQLYLEVVTHWLSKADLVLNDETRAEALRWSQMRGQRSGRAAYQFAKHWIGMKQLENQHV